MPSGAIPTKPPSVPGTRLPRHPRARAGPRDRGAGPTRAGPASAHPGPPRHAPRVSLHRSSTQDTTPPPFLRANRSARPPTMILVVVGLARRDPGFQRPPLLRPRTRSSRAGPPTPCGPRWPATAGPAAPGSPARTPPRSTACRGRKPQPHARGSSPRSNETAPASCRC